jgi:acyl carrier protein
VSPNITQTVMGYVVSVLLDGDGRDFTPDVDLIESRILDSFSALQLVTFLNTTFEMSVPLSKVNATNLRTVAAIAKLVGCLLSEGGGTANGGNPSV